MARRAISPLLLIWVCFLARAGWHAVFLPLWEGFDEWAHVAYLQRLAGGQGLPLPSQTRVTREVQASLSLTPMPAVPLSAPHLTHTEYWRLPEAERAALRRKLESLPRQWVAEEAAVGERNYEAQQPPLYYLLLAPLERALRAQPLPARVLALRLAGVLLASLTIPLIFAVVRRAAEPQLGIAAAALAAAMPLPAMTAARVGNDALSMVLFSVLLWAVLRAGSGAGLAQGIATGGLLGAGLLTKAYFLTAIPAVAALYGWRALRDKQRRLSVLQQAGAVFGMAALISFWWYWRNYTLTGSWSGLQQVAGDRAATASELVRQALQANWTRFAETAFNTHLWIGHWSFLQVRAWMYDVLLAAYALAAAGLIVLFLRRRSEELPARGAVAVAFLFCGCFWLGLAYHEVTFARLGMSSSAGWYAVALISMEALLLTVGWRALCPGAGAALGLTAGVILFALLDLYAANFILLPYYTGFIAHDASGRLAAFHLSQLAGGGAWLLFARAGGGVLPPLVNALIWCAHAAATIALPFASFQALRQRKA